ncbi:hypothetical protein [Microcoleus sp. herbarium2]|uniref:hypothetical protein n=1 Tax=Microcoleus sp. herbarium2 TaxID=3055433 RepID=UPI002FD18DE5
MNDGGDAVTTILTQIADALEKHNEILANHQNHLERLSGEVAGIKKKAEDLEAASSIDSNDAKFIASISTRLKSISSTLDAKP